MPSNLDHLDINEVFSVPGIFRSKCSTKFSLSPRLFVPRENKRKCDFLAPFDSPGPGTVIPYPKYTNWLRSLLSIKVRSTLVASRQARIWTIFGGGGFNRRDYVSRIPFDKFAIYGLAYLCVCIMTTRFEWCRLNVVSSTRPITCSKNIRKSAVFFFSFSWARIDDIYLYDMHAQEKDTPW